MRYFVKRYPTIDLTTKSGKLITQLLWGDHVHFNGNFQQADDRIRVKARGATGYVSKKHLRPETNSYKGLLEMYIIDVGQGDGVLLRTPDDKWHLIDAGVSNEKQMTKKGAANFLCWKFYKDLGHKKIELHSLTASHPDFDHYGGMLDLLGEKLFDGTTFKVEVENFYHCGMGRFKYGDKLGKMERGTVKPFPKGSRGIPRKGEFITELLDDKASFANPPRRLNYPFSTLAELIDAKCKYAKRLSLSDQYMPGYEPGNNKSKTVIHVLGPILEEFKPNEFGLRKLAPKNNPDWWESKTRNGHSVAYRIDYKDARLLLTGDLNTLSQNLLLSYVSEEEYASDVAKGCHHGAEDVEVDFIKAMQARATVISSGDNETYAHPRPILMGASAFHGRQSLSLRGKVQTPLLYSTELSRSVTIDKATSVKIGDPNSNQEVPPESVTVEVKDANFSDDLKDTPLCIDLIYGLVNVRTDGKRILCATMLESEKKFGEKMGDKFDVKMFKAGVDVIE